MISLFLVIHFPVSRARIHVYYVFGMREIDLGRSLDIAGQAISSTPTTSSNADEHELSFTGTKSVRGKQHNGLCTRCSTEFPSIMWNSYKKDT